MAPLEISIPMTSTVNDTGKPYTLYHIQLSLPLRTHHAKKRYSDFDSLDAKLKSETSAPPPSTLPPKSWLKSTINSEALTEKRRAGLEAYLSAILTSNDSRWRSSAAWKAFLDLPYQQSSSSNNGGATATSPTTLDPKDWLQAHRDIKSHIHQARVYLNQRDKATNPNDQHARSADAKASLVRGATILARCEESLQQSPPASSSAPSAGAGELRRRRDLLAGTKRELESLETVLRSSSSSSSTYTNPHSPANPSNDTSNSASARASAALFDGSATAAATPTSSRPGRVLGGPLANETDTTRQLDNQGVLALQKQTMADQEQDVLVLGQAVARMKDMGIMINEELVVQNEMLRVVEGDVERVQGKVDVAKKRIAKIS